MIRRAVFLLLAFILCVPAPAATPNRQISVPLPPLGWGSWNSFSNTIDAKIIMQQAQAMVSSGMRAAGYRSILIDEGWWLGQRDAQGNILVDPKAWPALAPGEQAGDMANIARFIHAQGLKAAIYTDAGRYGCSMFPDLGPKYDHTGSFGHYDQDFLQFAKWGFDYVKVDWCGGDKPNLDPAFQYAEIARAIARAEAVTGHPLYFSICNWGRQSPWTWAPGVGNITADMWRTSGDIVAPIVAGNIHADRRVSLKNVLTNFDAGIHPEAQHTGYYNDLDMMVLAMPGMTESGNRLHMTLWAISGAPLIVGADLTKLTPADRAILNNPAVLAVNQDPLGLQGVKVAETSPGLQVWAKLLSRPGERAVVLLNRTNSPASISVKWDQLGLAPTGASVVDLWTKTNHRAHNDYSETVPANDAVLLQIKGTDAQSRLYRTFENIAASGNAAFLRIAYRNPGKTTLINELRINGQDSTKVAFPPTGPEPGSISVEAALESGHQNALVFSSPCPTSLKIESVTVSSW